MSFEFRCEHCKSFTIFKHLDIDAEDRCCANCEKVFRENDLIRFDRTDQDKVGTLLPPDEAIDVRLKILAEAVEELRTKVETILLGLEDLAEEDGGFDTDQKN